jgi:hypothetical protein
MLRAEIQELMDEWSEARWLENQETTLPPALDIVRTPELGCESER